MVFTKFINQYVSALRPAFFTDKRSECLFRLLSKTFSLLTKNKCCEQGKLTVFSNRVAVLLAFYACLFFIHELNSFSCKLDSSMKCKREEFRVCNAFQLST